MMITFVWRFRGRGGDDALLAALATLYIAIDALRIKTRGYNIPDLHTRVTENAAAASPASTIRLAPGCFAATNPPRGLRRRLDGASQRKCARRLAAIFIWTSYIRVMVDAFSHAVESGRYAAAPRRAVPPRSQMVRCQSPRTRG